LGSNQTRAIDVRIISASSHALRQLVEQQKFREDLYYRLHVYPIYVPPLQERRQDVPLLAHHFLKKFSHRQRKQAESFHEHLLEYMKQRTWEGNIRQLENFVERLVTLTPPEIKALDETILPADVKKELKKRKPEIHVEKSLPDSVAEFEAQLIRRALEAHDWNQSQAARALKIPVQTLHYKMNKLGIARTE
jgi:DNA-binding NtrC family response regulator